MTESAHKIKKFWKIEFFLSKNAVYCVALAIFGLLLFTPSFLYNKIGGVLAQEPSPELKPLVITSESPVGETIDETKAFAEALILQLGNIEREALVEIDAAKQLVPLADQCQAANCDTPTCIPPFNPNCAYCASAIDPGACEAACEASARPCTTQGGCSGGFDKICPATAINAQLTIIQGNYNQTILAGRSINDLINKKTAYWVLTVEMQKFINSWPQPIRDFLFNPQTGPLRYTRHRDILVEVPDWFAFIPGWNYTTVFKTKREKLSDQLNESRVKITKCELPAADYERAFQGTSFPKFLLDCERARNANVFSETEKPCYPNNYFCVE